MSERMYVIGLSRVPGLGPRRIELLLKQFGSAREVWLAKSNLLYCIKEIPTKTVDEFIRVRQRLDLTQEMDFLARRGISVYTIEDEEYPEALRNIHNPPVALYLRGTLPGPLAPAVAIVGARRCTPYGAKMARDIARSLAEANVAVISGLARGIDSAAHWGCLEVMGKTVAVLGTGVDVVYPRENAKLMDEIIGNGAVVSEFPPGTKADPRHFPSRNRIISGLSQGILVVEAAETSGSLITADLALEQGREVFAVPGPATSPLSRGTNYLIKQGAKLVDCANDIFEEIGLESPSHQSKPKTNLSPVEARILSILDLVPVSIEEIVDRTKLSVSEVAGNLTYLELKGLVRRLQGRLFVSTV